jgi:hypothetical protein
MSITTITVDVWVCDSCGYQWRVVSREHVPKRCSRCKSRTWNRSAQPKVPFSIKVGQVAADLIARARRRRERAEERELVRLVR